MAELSGPSSLYSTKRFVPTHMFTSVKGSVVTIYLASPGKGMADYGEARSYLDSSYKVFQWAHRSSSLAATGSTKLGQLLEREELP